jgi:hypothetical protein
MVISPDICDQSVVCSAAKTTETPSAAAITPYFLHIPVSMVCSFFGDASNPN